MAHLERTGLQRLHGVPDDPEALALVAELDKVVLFIDQVEEIAGTPQPRTVSAAQGVTSEMLKLIPPFREQDERLLICATNSVRAPSAPAAACWPRI